MTGINQSLAMWLWCGERGVSSNTIVHHLTGLDTLGGFSGSHPHDPSDLRRCELLLDACPELAADFDRMRTASPEWAALVEVWPTLVKTMDEEAPHWRAPRPRGDAPVTYWLMRHAIEGVGGR